MSRKMLFFVNPQAGQQELRQHLLEVLQVFSSADCTVTVHLTRHAQDITEQIRLHGGEYDLIVCAGGDGTLNEAVSGLMTLDAPPLLGYIPGGTVNDVASTLGLPKHPVEAARAIVHGTPRSLDVGQFGADRWFTYVAGFGAFTDVAYETPQAEKRLLGRMAYLLTGAKGLDKIKPIPTKFRVNGRDYEDDLLLGLVCSTTSVGGFQAGSLLDVSLDDGLSEVILVRNITSLADLNGIGTLLIKRQFDPRFFHVFQTDHISFSFPEPVKWTLDGEFGGSVSEVSLENRRRAVNILV